MSFEDSREERTELWGRDRDEFNRKARESIENLIQRAAPENQPELRRLQARIDELVADKNPDEACGLVYEVMMSSAYDLQLKISEGAEKLRELVKHQLAVGEQVDVLKGIHRKIGLWEERHGVFKIVG
jgi:hypothetical protein